MSELMENVALADTAEVGALTVREELAINQVRDAYRELRAVNCASCRPCMPCPQGIDVPRILEIYNEALIYGDVATAAAIYRDEQHHADECVECGLCERRCSRRVPLPIISWLRTAHALLAGPGWQKETGGEATFIRCDVSKARDVEALVAQTVGIYGSLDYAYNNATVGPDGKRIPRVPIVDQPEDLWDRQVAVNLTGVFLCLKYEMRQMMKQGRGAIANCSSVQALKPVPGMVRLCCHKDGSDRAN
jgi:NAD(P)-dependent dehydrogenase (short-subunit alcohol dehydrogenase family)